MRREADIARLIHRDVEQATQLLTLETVHATDDATVTVGEGTAQREILRAVGVVVAPGDQVLVARVGRGEVAIAVLAQP